MTLNTHIPRRFPTAIRGIALWVFVTTFCLGNGLLAQSAPDQPVMTSLVADVVRIDQGQRLVASGNVEVFSQGRRLRAESLTYDRENNRLFIEGPIVIQDGTGTIVLADQGELDADLNNGILQGARLVLQDQLQIAGAEMSRREGRFSDLKQVVASSCEVCARNNTPLWEIRASRVIHDEDDKQIYFYDARFRIAGVPVFYLPILRVPDGTEDRVNGFLTPSFTSSTDLGSGFKLPYFFTLGDSADLTITPYVASSYTRTLEARYRRAFANGDLSFEGAASRDSILPGKTRAYLFGTANFEIAGDYDLDFQLQTTSDDQYLRDYDYSNKDRLETSVGLFRARAQERVEGQLVYFQSLRSDEVDDEQPTYVADGQWNRRFFPQGIDGWFDFDLLGHAHTRPSEINIEGRDMAQLRARMNWSRIWTTGAGLRFDTDARLNADLKYIGNDDRYPETQAALTPTTAVTMSYPLSAQGAGGVRYLVEPIAQFVWTAEDTLDGPNDDSTLTAFDTGNLFDLNRFPGLDRQEEGGRTNLALRWTRFDPDGWTMALTGGKVLRSDDFDQFPMGTGLAGDASNWLAQVDLDYGARLMLRSLTLMDSGFEPTLNQTRVSWQSKPVDFSSTYIWQREDAALDLTDDLSELSLEAGFNISDNWRAEVDVRRDFVSNSTNDAALGLIYTNECVRVDLSLDRTNRTDENDDIESNTSFGLSVTLAGFGSNNSQSKSRRRCTN